MCLRAAQRAVCGLRYGAWLGRRTVQLMEDGGGPVVYIPGEGEYPHPPLASTSPYPPVVDAPDGGPGPGPSPEPALPEAAPKPRRRRRTGRIIALSAASLIV